MQILINHLTRMQAGFICAAGIDLQSGLHIRPVSHRPLSTQLLRCHGGPLELGHVLNMSTSNFAGKFPEIEDRTSDPATWTADEPLAPAQLLDWLISLASDSLTEIFGPDLQPHAGRTFVIPEQRGCRSLGCFWAERPRIDVDPVTKKLHFVCRYQPFPLSLPITDIGLYGADHVTVDESAVANTNAILRTLPRVLISVGVSRPYRKANDQPAFHWLQVNNIHAALTARFTT